MVTKKAFERVDLKVAATELYSDEKTVEMKVVKLASRVEHLSVW
jgi:hypothetical protein